MSTDTVNDLVEDTVKLATDLAEAIPDVTGRAAELLVDGAMTAADTTRRRSAVGAFVVVALVAAAVAAAVLYRRRRDERTPSASARRDSAPKAA